MSSCTSQPLPATWRSDTCLQVTPTDGFAWGSVVVGGQPLDITNEFDRRLAEGCAIACRLRGAVKQQLGR